MTPLTAKQRLDKALAAIAEHYKNRPIQAAEMPLIYSLWKKIEEIYQGPQGEKGDRGEKGDSIVGPPGPRGETGSPGKDGKDGFTPKKGVDYFDGKDGLDAIANMEEVRNLCEKLLKKHTKEFDHKLLHDSKQIGKYELSEATLQEGDILQVQGNKLVGVKLPKAEQQRYFGGGGGSSNVRSISVTESRELDAMGIYVIDATSGNITITVPSAAGRENYWYELIRIDGSSNTVTINPTGSETMSGMTDYQLIDQWSTITLFAYNSNYLMRHV